RTCGTSISSSLCLLERVNWKSETSCMSIITHYKSDILPLTNAEVEVKALVAEHPDATLVELCELFAIKTGNWVSRTAMCRCLQKLGLHRKKKTWYSRQAATERVQKLRVEYWEKIKHIEPKNLVFLDETGILLGLSRTHARSQPGTRVTELKPFYRGAKVTAIGAISINKVLALMTMNDSMDGQAFAVFIEKFLCPQLWAGAVVVMDNLPAHKLASILPMITDVGASVICLSPYSPDFNPIELWWSQLKSFLRRFAPTSTSMIDLIIAVALNLMNPQHLRNWFANCCYCTS
ncbi:MULTISPECIES: IS630 family transposase, partial [unclassified Microcoleus]|uniref:IS630 family transposase n=1 Tax=unclassified Microcoleus TaxID=2642155 RepID=UPI002FD05E52